MIDARRKGWLGGLLMGVMAMAQAADSQGIHVNGNGEVEVAPDMARVTLQVARQGRDAVQLKKEMDAVTSDVLAVTDQLQIERDDVTAAMVDIQPNHRYEDNRQILDGVNANRTISVTVRKLERLGELMNLALEKGVNSIGGVELDHSERVSLEQQALVLAIEDAKAEAGLIAREFGVRLAGVIDVQASSHSVRPQAASFAREAAIASDSSFSPGQILIRREIQATFAIGGQ